MLNKKISSLTFVVLTAAALLSACGGSGSVSNSDPAEPPPADPAPAAIEGVATPSSVSVVTATNAQ